MLKTLRFLSIALLLAAVSMGVEGLAKSKARGSLKPRAIPAYSGLDSGVPLSVALSPDGRRVAVLAIVPPASLGPGPYPLTLQIWDADQLTLLKSREIAVPRQPQSDSSSPDREFAPLECVVRYAGNGASLVVTEGSVRAGPEGGASSLSASQARLHVLAADDLRELRSVDLELSSDPRTLGVSDLEVSPGGDRIAVALAPIDFSIGFGNGASCQAFQGSEARVYDLGTGGELWKAPFENARIGGLGWAPEGSSLALTLQTGPGQDPVAQAFCPERKVDHNVLILDSASGHMLSGLNTGDVAGPICLGPRHELFTAPYHFFYAKSVAQKATVWNAQTGAVKRTIACPGRDVHDVLALSRDGSLLLGYVGKERFGYSWRNMQDLPENVDERFALWDVRSGDLLRISPSFSPLTHPAGKQAAEKQDLGWLPPALLKLGERITRGQAAPGKPQVQVAADGSKVLVFWPWHGSPLLFDVPK
jgi:WD40 repeat protein